MFVLSVSEAGVFVIVPKMSITGSVSVFTYEEVGLVGGLMLVESHHSLMKLTKVRLKFKLIAPTASSV